MLELLDKYIIEVNESEFNDYINLGYDVITSSEQLSSIYEELECYFDIDTIDKAIYEQFELYESSILLLLNNRYYWLIDFK